VSSTNKTVRQKVNLVKQLLVVIDLEVVNSYTTDLSGIHNIITVDDKSTWVNDYTKQVIRPLSRVLYLNCYHQTEVGHCLMSMSCHR
jgi:hypothetical protein